MILPVERTPPSAGRKLVALSLFVLSLVLIPLGLGMREPLEHDATTSVLLRSPPEVVRARIADVGRWSEWNPYIGPMRAHGTTRFETHPDRRTRLDYVLRPSSRPDEVVVALEARPNRLGATWTFRITPEGSGTKVVISERGFVESPSARFAMGYIVGHDVAILGLAQALEHAEADADAGTVGTSPR